MPRIAGTHAVRGDFISMGPRVTVRCADSKSPRHLQDETRITGKTPTIDVQDIDLRA